jgi:hypothetical protein
MSKYAFRTSLFVFLLSVMSINAQEAFRHWAVGIEAGTYGVGGTIATSLTKNIKLRIGVDGFGYTFSQSVDDVNITGYIPGTTGDISLTTTFHDLKWSTTHFKLLVDLYPVKDGVFSLSVGMFAGNNGLSLKGKIAQYPADAVFDFEETTIVPNRDGTFDGKVFLGNKIKPYLGIGLGRTIAKKRLAFKFDLGVVYQGAFRIESANVSNIGALENTTNNYASDHIPTFVSKLWPMVNFGLSYRIF